MMDYPARCWQRLTRIVIAVDVERRTTLQYRHEKFGMCIYVHMRVLGYQIKERARGMVPKKKMRDGITNKWTRPPGMTLNKNQVYDK